ncbi:MAG: head protein [Verrucomicrobia bacterium]|nr:head protein [Verrucomicrobiota bacterium]
MILTSATLQAVNKNVRTTFWDAYHGAGDQLIDQFAMRAQSSAAESIYGWLGAIPGLVELIGEPTIANLLEHAYSISNKEWVRIIGVKRADIERDNLGTYSGLLQALGIAARQHPDELLFTAMAAGFTTAGYTGKNFFDTDHEPKAGGTKFSNKGTKKISAANFDTARQNILSRLNYEGKPMGLGRKLTLVVSPTYDKTARDIVLADNLASGASNTLKGTATLVTSPWLAGASEHNWFLLDLGYPVKPFINQVERELEFTSQDQLTDESVFRLSEFRHKAYRRGNVGYGMPELAYGSTGADAA